MQTITTIYKAMLYQSIIFLRKRNFLAKWGWVQNLLAISILNMNIQQWVWGILSYTALLGWISLAASVQYPQFLLDISRPSDLHLRNPLWLVSVLSALLWFRYHFHWFSLWLNYCWLDPQNFTPWPGMIRQQPPAAKAFATCRTGVLPLLGEWSMNLWVIWE